MASNWWVSGRRLEIDLAIQVRALYKLLFLHVDSGFMDDALIVAHQNSSQLGKASLVERRI
jgi:hypothetical protein